MIAVFLYLISFILNTITITLLGFLWNANRMSDSNCYNPDIIFDKDECLSTYDSYNTTCVWEYNNDKEVPSYECMSIYGRAKYHHQYIILYIFVLTCMWVFYAIYSIINSCLQIRKGYNYIMICCLPHYKSTMNIEIIFSIAFIIFNFWLFIEVIIYNENSRGEQPLSIITMTSNIVSLYLRKRMYDQSLMINIRTTDSENYNQITNTML